MNGFIAICAAWLLDMLILSRVGPPGRMPVPFTISYVLGFLMMILLVHTCPQQWSFKRVAGAVVVLGMLGRILFWDFPVGNDVYRYIWEGVIQNHGFNPYQVAPDDPSLGSLIRGDLTAIWQHINHRELSAAYPPLVMILFRGLAAISTTPAMFKGAMLAFDLLTLIPLILLVRRRNGAPANLFFYAANPLVLVYVAGEAHLDSVQAAFLVWGIYFICTEKPVAGFLMLGSAVASKYFAVVALPFVIHRSNMRAWPALAVAGLWFLPFVDDLPALFDSLFIFGSSMHYNDGLGEVVRFLSGNVALPVLALILFGLLATIYLFDHADLHSVYMALGVLLVCLPTLHPWYLVLMAPLMVFYSSRAWLYLMAATIATLPVIAIEYHTGVFREMPWLKIVEYLPFYGLLILDTMVPTRQEPAHMFPEARTVSVVIPTLNEADRIEATIQSTHSEPGITEVLVVDGGSHDGTADIARAAGARVLSSPPGRGRQVHAGICRTSGDIILVLHADTTLLPKAVESMRRALAKDSSIAGGAFQMRFSGQSARLAVIAGLNNFRARWLGISFGDQGQFFRRAALSAMGGYPDMMLMEDVELSMRLKHFGRPLFVLHGVRVSQRRWTNRGFFKNAGLVLNLFLRYLVERRFNGVTNIRTDYYRKYYNTIP